MKRRLADEAVRRQLAKNQKYIREDVLGDTQHEFAEKVGMSQGFISDVEKGKKIPGGEFFIAMHNLGIELNYIITGKGPIFLVEEELNLNRVGDRIKKIRLDNRRTEAEFAKSIEISVKELVSIEQNELSPAKNVSVLISHAYHADHSWIRYGGKRNPYLKGGSLDEMERAIREQQEASQQIDLLKQQLFEIKRHVSTLKNQEETRLQVIDSQKTTIQIQGDVIADLKDYIARIKKA